LVFGNQGALFMNAMTWWDHKTGSIWSQPWGRALAGDMVGTELELLPSQLVPWKTWREAYPDTLALQVSDLRFRRERLYPGYVIGVTLEGSSTAFPYELAGETGVINDAVGPYPVVVHVNPEKQSAHVYVRQLDDRVLNFVQEDGAVRDLETGSTWKMETGRAVDGPLQGQALRSVPYIPSFESAWRDFYPDSRWYDGS
jgi:hypothetical protein